MPQGYYLSGESTFYRGINKSELNLLIDTGNEISYFTRQYGDEKTINLLNSLGPADVRDLISDHAETSKGYIRGKLFHSPFISVTKDIRVAASFAGEKGYILVIKVKGAIQNIGGEGREWEFLIPGSIKKEEVVGVISPADVQKIKMKDFIYGKKAPFNFTIHTLMEFPLKKRTGFIGPFLELPSKQVQGFQRAVIPRTVVISPEYPDTVAFSRASENALHSTAGVGIRTVGRTIGTVFGVAGTIAAAYDFATISPDEEVIKGFYKAMRQCADTKKGASSSMPGFFLDALKDGFPLWAANLGFDDVGRMLDKNFDKKFKNEFQTGMAYIQLNCKGVWNDIRINASFADFRQGILDWLDRIPEIHDSPKTGISAPPPWKMGWPTSGFDLVGQ